jgi:endo-1,4-beta-mannosidase
LEAKKKSPTSDPLHPTPVNEQQQFVLGVNYWPVSKAMSWWQDFDVVEAEADFGRMAASGLRTARIFLLWEDFQPSPFRISVAALRHLVRLADIAATCGVLIIPTFFCGHMSGVNWLPGWMLAPGRGAGRFPVWSGGRQLVACIRNWYSDREVIGAQQLQCREVARALAGHPAVWAYDLGNESSNCVIPPDRSAARQWLEVMVGEIRQSSGNCRVTLGMHAEDLEDDRHLWPQDAAAWCDFLCMHGYPFYLSWADEFDVRVLPFLGLLTQWLGGKPVLFEEFGAPSRPVLPPYPGGAMSSGHGADLAGCKTSLWPESSVAGYYRQALDMLCQAGMSGAMAWCYGDYHPSLWSRPPLKDNPHERYFGLFRHDGSPKPAVQVFGEFANCLAAGRGPKTDPEAGAWLRGEDRERYYDSPRTELPRLYLKYKECLEVES